MLKRIRSRLLLPASLAAVVLALAVVAAVATAAQPMTIVVNGKVLSGASPQLIGGRLYVPLRVVGELTGLSRAYDDAT